MLGNTCAYPLLINSIYYSAKRKLYWYFYWLAIYFQHGIGKKIDWARLRPRFNNKVAPTAKFNAVGRMMPKIIS